ncbi:MAG TPA: RNA-binding protein [Candidatus Hydrogenedentes bacterium]|nr:RNA-binding protein [Candidatus Hydrogenedentota bacterium]HOS01512.1 RNA-binding protein [Candidatus Hydrogenedentota bacterium]
MNIYVGNLSYSTMDSDLQATFEPFGTVTSARVIMDKVTGRSRGFGFVEMANNEEGKAAIAAIDGKELQGRALKVNEARPQEDRRSSAPRGGSRGGGYGSRW